MTALKSNPLHSNVTAEWYTPSDYVEAARSAMKGIDVDPASSIKANETVRAKSYYDIENSGLAVGATWVGRVFINPPGGLVREYWRRLQTEIAIGRTSEAIWIGYSLQQLQTLQIQGYGPIYGASVICYPRKRIAFITPSGDRSTAPTHANYVAYLGPNLKNFKSVFVKFGEVR